MRLARAGDQLAVAALTAAGGKGRPPTRAVSGLSRSPAESRCGARARRRRRELCQDGRRLLWFCVKVFGATPVGKRNGGIICMRLASSLRLWPAQRRCPSKPPDHAIAIHYERPARGCRRGQATARHNKWASPGLAGGACFTFHRHLETAARFASETARPVSALCAPNTIGRRRLPAWLINFVRV